ncbi:MAG TPA: hypothetical protein VFS05_09795, partial [Gemmatimonadaceae bacterium]|nr:hypothetical protein [Gemmatimonadaceae bacterium]
MREPRHILLRARAAASARAERLRQRLLAPHAAVPLDEVRRRLELLLAALHGRVIHIDAAEPPSRRSRLERIVSPEPRHLRHEEALPSTDGERIRLPASLRAEGGADDAMARYRLLALEQGERVARGTAALAPGEDDALARDLYLLREAAAVDAALARAMPSLAPALAARRAEALAHRPPLDGLTPAEREAERLVRRLLAAGPAAPPAEIGGDGAPADSRAWAEEAAARVRAAGGGYRGLAPVPLWGVVTAPAATAPAPRPRSEPPLPTTGPDIDIAPIERYRPGDAPGEGAPATPATESRRPQVEAREGAPVRAAGTGAADESRDRADAQPAAPLHPAAEPPAVLHPEDEASRVVEEREAQLGELVVEYPEW